MTGISSRSGAAQAVGPLIIEWPTLCLAAIIYGGWLTLTLCADRLPDSALLLLGGWFMAWHMSLQHGIIHGHPTNSRPLNDAIAFAPLSLWLPYQRYRTEHRLHHGAIEINDPLDDPESYYRPRGSLERMGTLRRHLLSWQNTLAGRIALGPALGMTGFISQEASRFVKESAIRLTWLVHLAGVAAIVVWLVVVCRIDLLRYLAFFVYPGYALTLVRSFAEHRAATDPAHRTAIVERAPVLGLLFLFNNLHLVHHVFPELPWYEIPGRYRRNRNRVLQANNGLVNRGYRGVLRRYLFRGHDLVEHPSLHGNPTG